MTRKCPVCGKEYRLTPFRFDKGVCSECPESGWPAPTPEGTRTIWKRIIYNHVVGTGIALLLLGLILCDTSPLSVPLVVYSGTVCSYFFIRFLIAAFRGYPVLTAGQELALMLLPFYGLPATYVLFYLAQAIRYGN